MRCKKGSPVLKVCQRQRADTAETVERTWGPIFYRSKGITNDLLTLQWLPGSLAVPWEWVGTPIVCIPPVEVHIQFSSTCAIPEIRIQEVTCQIHQLQARYKTPVKLERRVNEKDVFPLDECSTSFAMPLPDKGYLLIRNFCFTFQACVPAFSIERPREWMSTFCRDQKLSTRMPHASVVDA
jgi:hypothetical protein